MKLILFTTLFALTVTGSVAQFQDPLYIQNSSVTLNETTLQGTFSLSNGVVKGLSTLKPDFNYNPTTQRVTANITLQRFLLTGIYEIVDGRANIPIIGEHTFSGKGDLNVSFNGAIETYGFTVRTNPETQHVSIADLSFSLGYADASIVAENLIVDGRPVGWEEVNQFLRTTRPVYEEMLLSTVQKEINRLLEGRTWPELMKLLIPFT